MTDFGSDISTFPDLDPFFSLTTGIHVVAEALARRLMTPRGGGLFYAPDYGLDVRGYLNSAMTTAQLSGLEHSIQNEALKDERIFDAKATVTANVAARKLAIKVLITTAQGPFALVLQANAVTVQVLKVNNAVAV